MEGLGSAVFLAQNEELSTTSAPAQELLDMRFAEIVEATEFIFATPSEDGEYFRYIDSPEYAEKWATVSNNTSVLVEMLQGNCAGEALDVVGKVVRAETDTTYVCGDDQAAAVLGEILPELKDIMCGGDRGLADKAFGIVVAAIAEAHADPTVQTCFAEKFLALATKAQTKDGKLDNEDDNVLYSKLMSIMTGQDKSGFCSKATIHKQRLVEAFAIHIGLHDQNLVTAWSNAAKPQKLHRYTKENILTMVDLERRQPGLCKGLNEEFGIKNFARCTPQTWARMYKDHTEEPGKSYVLALQAAADYNGAFWRPETFDVLSRQLERQGFGLKIYECDNKEDVYEASLRAKWRDKVHGAKVASALVLAHGSPSGFILGFFDRLSTNDLERISLEDVAEAFGASAGVAWVSCSTGKEVDGGPRSIGHVAARKLGRVSTAPTAAVGFGSIRSLKRGPEAVQLQVQYLGRKSAKERFATRPKPAKYDGAALNAADKTEVLEGSKRGRRSFDLSEMEAPPDLTEFIHVMDKPVVELGPIEIIRDTSDELEQEIVTL